MELAYNMAYINCTATCSDHMENAMQTNAPRRTEPTQSLLQGKPWTPPPATNVQDTWRKFGWLPRSEAKK